MKGISDSGSGGELRWMRVDLHIHTPASEDYAEQNVSYLDILREAEHRELEIIAFTDHNTVHGYEQFQHELEILQTLEKIDRLGPEERERLEEYRRLCRKITVLPGFEFTSHYGAHVLGIFSPEHPVSLLEATLLQLGIPYDLLKKGVCGVPNTRHVTEAYEIIARAGGLVIAAHANGPNGVITETLRMGTSGQSRVAATQSPALSALEFINFYTDHEKFTSPSFYNGKTEHYERRMFCIQGSDAHRLRRVADSQSPDWHCHGIGDRYVELLLPDNSFASLRALFQSQDFNRVRVPKRDHRQWEVDALRYGVSSERQILRLIGGENDPILQQLWRDVAALANAGGGTLFLQCQSGNGLGQVHPGKICEALRMDVQQHLEQQPYLSHELINCDDQDIVRIEVKATELPPYTSSEGIIYVRRGSETTPANRGEILQLCRRALAEGGESPLDKSQELDLPRSGVEIVSEHERNNEWYYEVRDLRTTVGVTSSKAQGLWAYAIARHRDIREQRVDPYSQVRWHGRLGIWRVYRQGNRVKYDLVHRNADGLIDHIFYGVSQWGLGEGWLKLIDEQQGNLPQEQETGYDFEDAQELEPTSSLMEQSPTPWGDRRHRWRGRGGIWNIYRNELGEPRFHLVMRDEGGNGIIREFKDIPLHKLTLPWLNLIRVPRPRTGIEVVQMRVDEDGEWIFVFRDLRNSDHSVTSWRLRDIKAGTVREYAARMYQQDMTLDDSQVRWWGNIGYLRPMRSQVDLIYRDEHGMNHFFYAARRDELVDEWRGLLEIYNEV